MSDLERIQQTLDAIVEASKITLKLAKKSGLVDGYRWRAPPASWTDQTRLTDHRSPPLPFHSFLHRGSGTCRVCGQPVYAGGAWQKGAEARRPMTWHTVCVTTYTLMTKPATYSPAIVFRQKGLCAVSGEPLGPPAKQYLTGVEIDHGEPLYRVARDRRDEPWFELLPFWLLGNLRAISRAAHVAKGADEAKERAGAAKNVDGQGSLL